MRKYFFIPFILFLFIVILLWRGLQLHPNEIPSPLVGEPSPHFSLPVLFKENILTTEKDFLGRITLVNVWASWCYACEAEHSLLLKIAKTPGILLYGLNYKDDVTRARAWLEDKGNPYAIIALDQTGNTAIDWGVYGTPETFVVDKKGFIRYKYIGAITENGWQETLYPIIQQLQHESP